MDGINFVLEVEQQLCRDEGVRLTLYQDSEGIYSIGVGRNLEANGIRESEAMTMLRNDVIDVIHDLEGLDLWWKLDEARQGCLVNMCFNLGLTRLLTFKKMFEAIEHGNFELAALEMLDSKWARQVGDRAARLSDQMRRGEWVN